MALSRYLQSQRTRVATAEGLTSALAVQQGLTDAVSVPGLLERTRPPRGRRCCTATASGSPARCPSPRRTYRRGARTLPRPAGRAVRQRAEVQGDPRLFVAVPVGYGNGGSGGAYVAVLPLTELDGTLKTLSAVLAGVRAADVGVVHRAGRVGEPSALRPIERVSAAVAAVAAGDLDARLRTEDPGLRALAETFNVNAAALQAASNVTPASPQTSATSCARR